MTTLTMWGKEGEQVLQKARGTYAPYRIRNCTGLAIFVWSDIEGSSSMKDASAVKILNDQTIDWRFDDWRTMREVTNIFPSLRSLLKHTSSMSPQTSIV